MIRCDQKVDIILNLRCSCLGELNSFEVSASCKAPLGHGVVWMVEISLREHNIADAQLTLIGLACRKL